MAKSDFWKQADKEWEEELKQSEEDWKFKAEQFAEMRKHPGWLIFVDEMTRRFDQANMQMVAIGYNEAQPNLYRMGYLQGIRDTLLESLHFVDLTIEEEIKKSEM